MTSSWLLPIPKNQPRARGWACGEAHPPRRATLFPLGWKPQLYGRQDARRHKPTHSSGRVPAQTETLPAHRRFDMLPGQMTAPIKLISTDFDGTLFSEFEMPPIPKKLERLIADFQARGGIWVINTGRDMSSLMEALARAQIGIQPDYLVLVEREIFVHDGVRFAGIEDWNAACTRDHAELFARVRADVPRITDWVNRQFRATVYEDVFSPFCLIASNNGDADQIHAYLDDYCRAIPDLTVVRNDVYARFSHVRYNKGTALAELSRRLNITAAEIVAAGDHLNDLPMLQKQYALGLVAPHNAIPSVKAAVTNQGGFVSQQVRGDGVAEGLAFYLQHG